MKILNILFLVGLVLITACSESIPPPDLNGPWKVGGTTFEINDQTRWIQVRAWFPSNQESNDKMLSSDKHSIAAFAKSIGIPKILMGSEELSRTNLNVSIADGKFPLLIFNHGLMSYERQNTTQFEQLASHGYIVLSIANPSDSMVVVRQNGEVIFADENSSAYQALQKQKDGAKELAPKLKHDIQQAKASQTFKDYQQNMAVLADNPVFKPMSGVFEMVYKNNQLLLDSLKNLQEGKIQTVLSGHLDLNNVGVFGHSFGSIMSGQLAMNGVGIKAAFGMDAPQLNIMPERYHSFSVPVCYVYADSMKFAGEILDTTYINRPLLKADGSCEAVFKQSAHYNFTDLNFITPLRYSPMLGKAENKLVAQNLEALLLAFFDTHLKGKNTLSSLKLNEVELHIY